MRESDLVLLTHAGPEIGVASTKAFTTQLVALLLLTLALGRYHGVDEAAEAHARGPDALAPRQDGAGPGPGSDRSPPWPSSSSRSSTLPLPRPRRAIPHRHGGGAQAQGDHLHPRRGLPGRRAQARPPGPDRRGHAGGGGGPQQRPAGEAQVQPAGGPRPRRQALRLRRLPGPHGRGDGVTVISLPETDDLIDPFIFTIPLQLLAYHVAVLKGTDVDQPRNLAKSVTVE